MPLLRLCLQRVFMTTQIRSVVVSIMTMDLEVEKACNNRLLRTGWYLDSMRAHTSTPLCADFRDFRNARSYSTPVRRNRSRYLPPIKREVIAVYKKD